MRSRDGTPLSLGHAHLLASSALHETRRAAIGTAACMVATVAFWTYTRALLPGVDHRRASRALMLLS